MKTVFSRVSPCLLSGKTPRKVMVVRRVSNPGNGLLVDAALGASRFNHYVPV